MRHRPSQCSQRCALALVVFGLGACSANTGQDAGGTVEVFGWWSSPSELLALDALLEVHAEGHPDIRVINAAEDQAEEARNRLPDRMRRGAPPDTFQANIGRDLKQWVLFDGRTDGETKVASLNPVAEQQGWIGVIPEPLWDEASYRGTLYGVPLNIHRINTLFYNIKVLNDEGLDPPESLDELHDVLDLLIERGYEQPISIGSEHPWTLTLLTMENLFPAVAGAEFYTEYWAGRHEPEHEIMHQTLHELMRLWPYFNADALEIGWTDGVDRLFAENKAEQAVFTVMGDWAKGHLEAEGHEPGEDFGSMPFPGSQGTFVYTSDCFPLPKGAPHSDDATDLLVTIGSMRGQLRFNDLKGSIPARRDVDVSELDALAQVTWRDFNADQPVLAISGLLDTDFEEDVGDALQETLLDQDPDPVLFALRNNL